MNELKKRRLQRDITFQKVTYGDGTIEYTSFDCPYKQSCQCFHPGRELKNVFCKCNPTNCPLPEVDSAQG